ncbi:MAG: PP2C family serine/threonine-protein phosphatase [Mycobacterium sp.]
MTLVLRYTARSDRGLVRANNEDSVYAGARLLALADGMGGHAAGEVASQLVIAALAHLDDDEPGGDLLSQLNSAVHQGNSAIAAHVEADPELEGMGTTLTAILFAGNRLGLVHIGDSRGYLLRDGELTQITKDDTFVQTLVDEGRITAEEAHSHPQRSLIMRALTGHEVEPTLTVREAHAGDRYLLCSDGLSDPVSHDTILDALQIPDVVESADRLIEMALRGGGPDNVTVVVADVVDYEYGQTQPILAGAVSGIDDHSAPPNTAAGRASAFNPRRAEAAKRPSTEPEPPPKKKRSRRTIVFAAILLVLVIVAGLAVARMWIRSYYYVGERDNAVFIMRGLPGTVLGVPLQETAYRACIDARGQVTNVGVDDGNNCSALQLDDLRPAERAQVVAGTQGTDEESALEQLRQLNGSVLPTCASLTPRTTTTTPPPRPTASSATPAPVSPTDSPTAASAPPPRGPAPGPAPETPTTVTGPPPTPAPPPGSPTDSQPTPTSEAPSPTPLPRQIPEPGTNCRQTS